VSESKGLFQQVRGYGKPILLRDSLLDRARIIAIDRVVKHLIEKRPRRTLVLTLDYESSLGTRWPKKDIVNVANRFSSDGTKRLEFPSSAFDDFQRHQYRPTSRDSSDYIYLERKTKDVK